MMGLAWRDQPVEQARLLNPAFLGALLCSAADGYIKEAQGGGGLHYALSFVALPIVLQKGTRDALPKTKATSMVAWVSANPLAQVGFADRAKALSPLIRDAILVASRGGLIRLQDNHVVSLASPKRLAGYGSATNSDEVRDCLKKANFVGRWFARSGEYTTVMALWGVRP